MPISEPTLLPRRLFIVPGARHLRTDADFEHRSHSARNCKTKTEREALLTRIYGDTGMQSWSLISRLLSFTCDIESFVIDVAHHEGPGFTFELDIWRNITELREHGLGRYYFLLVQLGQLYSGAQFRETWKYVSGWLQFSPAVNLFFAVMERCNLGMHGLQSLPSHPAERVPRHPWKIISGTELALNGRVSGGEVDAASELRWIGPCFMGEIFNDLLDEIRIEAKVQRLKRTLADQDATANRAISHMRSFVRDAFAQHSHLLVLRVTLEYEKAHVPDIDAERVRSDWERFAKRSRSLTAFGGAVGLIWRYDWGIERGTYFDCLLFLPEAVRGREYYIAGQLVETWKWATRQAGRTHIANPVVYCRSSSVVDVDEFGWEERLVELVTYLGEKDKYLRGRTCSGHRTYGIWRI